MAYVYKGWDGRPISEQIALLDGVQAVLEAKAFEIGVRAEEILLHHRQEGHAQILLMEGDIDHYVVLDDERGMDAALSIEFGRAGYIDPETGKVVGAMEPLYILTQAAHLPRKSKRMPALGKYARKLAKPKKRRKRKSPLIPKKKRPKKGGNSGGTP